MDKSHLCLCILFCICIRFGFAGASTSWQFARLQELLWWLSASAGAGGVMNIFARRAHPTLQCRDEYIILHCKKYTIAHPFGASLHSLKWIFKQTRRSKNTWWALLGMMTSRKCWWWLWINCSIYCINFCILWGNHLKTPNVVCDTKHTKSKICTTCHFTLPFKFQRKNYEERSTLLFKSILFRQFILIESGCSLGSSKIS